METITVIPAEIIYHRRVAVFDRAAMGGSDRSVHRLSLTIVPLLLLCGRPGAGKTEYSNQFVGVGFAAIETDKRGDWI
jgi:hypothetical protein